MVRWDDCWFRIHGQHLWVVYRLVHGTAFARIRFRVTPVHGARRADRSSGRNYCWRNDYQFRIESQNLSRPTNFSLSLTSEIVLGEISDKLKFVGHRDEYPQRFQT